LLALRLASDLQERRRGRLRGGPWPGAQPPPSRWRFSFHALGGAARLAGRRAGAWACWRGLARDREGDSPQARSAWWGPAGRPCFSAIQRPRFPAVALAERGTGQGQVLAGWLMLLPVHVRHYSGHPVAVHRGGKGRAPGARRATGVARRWCRLSWWPLAVGLVASPRRPASAFSGGPEKTARPRPACTRFTTNSLK